MNRNTARVSKNPTVGVKTRKRVSKPKTSRSPETPVNPFDYLGLESSEQLEEFAARAEKRGPLGDQMTKAGAKKAGAKPKTSRSRGFE